MEKALRKPMVSDFGTEDFGVEDDNEEDDGDVTVDSD
jgi:hypothetical protein